MTKLIWILIFAVIGFVAYTLFQQWEVAQGNRAEEQKQLKVIADGSGLAGMPSHLESGYRKAKEKSAAAFQTWFTANEKFLSDPRKAWIELELCVALSRSNPAEAKRIYERVKGRVPPSSPVYGKVKELEKTFQ